jgi:hypothetical protein
METEVDSLNQYTPQKLSYIIILAILLTILEIQIMPYLETQ